jgi:hypothetical protein
VIVDELDRLKEIKDRHVRWRAGYTLSVLDRLLETPTDRARLQAGDVIPGPDGRTRSQVTQNIEFDYRALARTCTGLPTEDPCI